MTAPQAILVPLALAATLASVRASAAASAADAASSFAPPHAAGALLSAHCLDCHGGGTTKGKLDLRPVLAAMDAGTLTAEQRSVLRHARVRVEAGEMPPPDEDDDAAGQDPASGDDPTGLDRRSMANALRAAVRTTGALPAPPGPAPRRLNRVEYANAVRDLLAIDIADLGTLPPDDVGAGFDNVASVLSLPPRALERHMDLAEAIAARACPDAVTPGATLADVHGDAMRVSAGKAGRGVALVWSRGTAETTVEVPARAHYEVTFTASGMQAGKEPVKVAVLVDGKAVANFDIPETAAAPGTRTCSAPIAAGTHTVAVEFLNDYFEKNGPGGKPADRNLAVHALSVRAPDAPPAPPAWQQRMASAVSGSPDEDAELRWLAARFLRRPATDGDLAVLRAAQAPVANAAHEARLRAALTALLVHPEFLFRAEPDPQPPQRERPLTDHEVATRLAGFLWCSVPDDALLRAAGEGRLTEPQALRAEVERMLTDARASRFADRFAPQWLAIDAIEDRSPNPAQYPGVDAALLGSMRAETVLFFDAVLRERRPARELLDADFTFIDARLAAHYGMPAPAGGGMRRTAVDPARGGGVLAHASVLLATSNPARTSPVKRGKWVLESILDSAPPPPPPGTPQLPDTAGTAASTRSMRELLAAHRADPSCAACHRRMDALGFALEGWDAVGRRRDRVAGAPVDDRGELPDGRSVAGLDALRRELAGNPDALRSLVRHLLTFATGRECGAAEDDHVDRLLESLGSAPTLHDVVIAVAESPAMRTRGSR
ncbi:MAG: DUF1592 domain-containing protein [Planctomycetes bacterium]|nr:DUF1592 domain-containing protein [Planctomycetota bacterium]